MPLKKELSRCLRRHLIAFKDGKMPTFSIFKGTFSILKGSLKGNQISPVDMRGHAHTHTHTCTHMHTHTHSQSDEFFAAKVSLVVLVRFGEREKGR